MKSTDSQGSGAGGQVGGGNVPKGTSDTGQKGTAGLRLAEWASIVSALAAMAMAAARMMPLATDNARWPQWDMAKYGASGSRLAEAVRELDLPAFARHVHELDVWPPVFPLIEMVVFLLFGSEISVARALMVSLFGLALCASFFAIRAGVLCWLGHTREENGDGWVRIVATLAGALVVAAMLSGPLFRTFGLVVMLEVPGLLLLSLALWAGFRVSSLGTGASGEIAAGRGREQVDGEGARLWRCLWLSSCALFFCKYNYGVIWLAGLAVSEGVRRTGSWRGLFAALSRWISISTWSRLAWPTRLATVLVALLGCWVLVLRATGGFELTVAGQHLSMSSAGNAAQAVFSLFVLGFVVREWRRARAAGEGWIAYCRRRSDALPVADRACVLYLILPISAWLALPPHLRQMVGFLENRSSDLDVLGVEHWWAYPRAFIGLYSAHPAVGVVLIALAAAFVGRGLFGHPARRLLAVVLLVHVAALLAHPYKLPRFGYSTAALIVLAAAGTLVDWIYRLGEPGRARVDWGIGVVLLALLLVYGGLVWAWNDEDVVRELRWRSAPASSSAALDAMADPELRDRTVVVLGTWNLLSPGLIEWMELHRRSVGIAAPGALLTDFELTRGRRIGRLMSALSRGSPASSDGEPVIERALVLELADVDFESPEPGGIEGGGEIFGPAFDAAFTAAEAELFVVETAWLDPVRETLANGGLPFVEEGVHSAPGSPYRWRIYRRSR